MESGGKPRQAYGCDMEAQEARMCERGRSNQALVDPGRAKSVEGFNRIKCLGSSKSKTPYKKE